MNVHEHPRPELLGSFFEGRLAGEERAAVVAHLALCDVCARMLRGTADAAADADAKPDARAQVVRFPRRPWLLVAACAFVAALGIAGGYRFLQARTDRGVRMLIAESPETYRTVEPRLTGFRWAELRHLRDGAPSVDAEGLKLAGAAGEVLSATRNDESARARRAAGVASLLVQDSGRAIEELRKATKGDAENAAAWNDLAAALYTEAVQQRRAASLPEALAAADRAAELAPSMPEARFNRALILERMGLRDAAAAAWRESLAADSSSPWANEARRHLAALSGQPQVRFGDRVGALEAAAAAGDVARVERELRQLPQEVRGWFESDVLGRWGDAELRDDVASAATLLASARTAGVALRRFSGESLLLDAVEIDAAANGERRRQAARGHAAYRRGRLAYRDRKLPEAERELLAAAAAFDAAGNPMSGMARVYAASVAFDQNRIEDAAAMVRPVRAGATHFALRGQAASLLARCSAYACRWSEALRHRAVALEAFRRAGEPSQIAESENMIGEIYSNAGDVEKAWEHRLAALEILGTGAHGTRLLAALATNARGELRARRYAAAGALLRLEIAEAERHGDPLLIADAWKRRARLHADGGDTESAARDLAAARGLAARASDSGLRARFEAECALVEGVVERTHDARQSVARLTAAIEFAHASGDRRLLPEALLERARTHRAAGADDAAWRDLAAGIEEVEDRRRTAEGGPGATFDAAAALFDEAIELLLSRGENERAFAYAGRAHARALLDAIDPGAPGAEQVTAADVPRGTMLVQYALLPRGVAAFALTPDGLHVTQTPIDRAALESDVRALREQIESRRPAADIQATAARLHALLIAPLGIDARTNSLVIAGDRVLQSVPWAALWDATRREYLVERAAVTVAPGLGVWRHHRARPAASRNDARLLLVTSDLRPRLDPLTDLRREIAAIEAAWPRREQLVDAEATAPRFLAAAAAADVVHYAGHARAASDTCEAALLLAGDEELTATAIARARLGRPRLVVLAACGTLAGETGGLEGSPGLARAFLAAGVPTVVGTLWPMHDGHAATLFAMLHERLRAGSRASDALRETQLDMIRGRDAELAHPAAWAAAQVLGAGE